MEDRIEREEEWKKRNEERERVRDNPMCVCVAGVCLYSSTCNMDFTTHYYPAKLRKLTVLNFFPSINPFAGKTRPVLDRFQDCYKNWSLNPFFMFLKKL